MKPVTPRLALVLGCVLLTPAAVWGEIYRCISPEGDTTYSDSRCPKSSAMSADVTEAVGACTTAACEAQHQRAWTAAQERLRADQAALAQMQEQRLKTEQLYMEQRFRSEQLRRMSSLEEQQQAALGGVYWPTYPLSPSSGYWLRDGRGWDRPGWDRPGCGPNCGVRPFPFAHGAKARFRGERPVKLIGGRSPVKGK